MCPFTHVPGKHAWAALLSVVLGVGACAPTVQTTTGDPAPTDAEIVAIAMASNTGEIETSQPAVSGATNANVRQFAQRMVTDHTAANESLQALGVQPRENRVSQALARSARESAQALQGYSGEALDRTYMNTQVQLHEYTLNTLDTYLIPSARSSALRAALEQMRTTVAAHLEQARQVRGAL